jgi:hypothetical protein
LGGGLVHLRAWCAAARRGRLRRHAPAPAATVGEQLQPERPPPASAGRDRHLVSSSAAPLRCSTLHQPQQPRGSRPGAPAPIALPAHRAPEQPTHTPPPSRRAKPQGNEAGLRRGRLRRVHRDGVALGGRARGAPRGQRLPLPALRRGRHARRHRGGWAGGPGGLQGCRGQAGRAGRVCAARGCARQRPPAGPGR